MASTRERRLRIAGRIGLVVVVIAAAAVAFSTRRPMVIEMERSRFGLIDATLGLETWSADAAAGIAPPAGPWGMISYSDPPQLSEKGWYRAGDLNGVSWRYVNAWLGVALLSLWPAGVAFRMAACRGAEDRE